MAAPLDFDTGTPGETISFKVRGKTPEGVEWVEEFECLSDIPATVMWDVEDASKRARQGEPMTSREVVMPFFEAALSPDDYSRFCVVIAERKVGAVYLTKIMQGLAQAVGEDRPTRPSPSSWAGRGSTPTTSAAAYASPPPVLPPPASATGASEPSLTSLTP